MIRRFLSCLVSVAVLLILSFSWVMAVDLTPAENRPYVGSSGTNSELSLALGNNGMGRLFGGDYRIGVDKTNQVSTPDGYDDSSHRPDPAPADRQQTPSSEKGSGGESGPASALRLYLSNNAGQIAWFLLPAILFSLAFLFLIIKGKLKGPSKNISLFYFSVCFLPQLLYFSFSNGVVHRYYLAMLAFPIAALIGIGISMIEEMKRHSRFAIPVLFLLTAIPQLYIQSLYKGWLDWLLPLSAGLFGLVLAIFILNLKLDLKRIMVTPLLSVLLVLPCIWSMTPILYGNNAQLPIAGPELVRQGDAFDRHPDLTELIAYLKENREDAAYLAAAPSAMSMGAELILQSGEPVMVLGGFNGGDAPATLDEFKQMAAQGIVRYAVLSKDGAGNASKQSPLLDWISRSGTKVQADFGEVTLYRLPDGR